MLLAPFSIEEWQPGSAPADQDLDGLSAVLHAAPHAGASVSFILPFSVADARAFWRATVLPGVEAGKRAVLLARNERGIVGTVQLILDTPPNQRHRAEVAKLLVLPEARRHPAVRDRCARAKARAGYDSIQGTALTGC